MRNSLKIINPSDNSFIKMNHVGKIGKVFLKREKENNNSARECARNSDIPSRPRFLSFSETKNVQIYPKFGYILAQFKAKEP